MELRYLDINTTKMKMITFTIADQRTFNEYKVEFLKELSKINDISFEMMRKWNVTSILSDIYIFVWNLDLWNNSLTVFDISKPGKVNEIYSLGEVPGSKLSFYRQSSL